MVATSPYGFDEAAPPDWLPGEHLAATAFVGMSLYLAFESNVAIYRVFTKKQGLYFWSLQVGSWAIIFDALGIIFKFIAPMPRAWPFYTLALTVGWGMFATSELLVLSSRLHLVYQNRRVLRYVYFMAWGSIPFIVFPACVVSWGACEYSNSLHASGKLIKYSQGTPITQPYHLDGLRQTRFMNAMRR